MLATQIAVSDGTMRTLYIGIEFFQQGDISVTLNRDVALIEGVDYVWSAVTTITFLSTLGTPGGVVPAGTEVLVRRATTNTEMYNTYDGGAPFSRLTLDENFEQLLRLSQEFSEGLGLDGLRSNLNMNGFRITDLGDGQEPGDAVNKGQVSALVSATDTAIRQEFADADAAIRQDFTAADAALQDQLNGTTPPLASAFSAISWHDQEIPNSVNIPDNKNAWSFGPTMTINPGQVVTIGSGSFWTIANGEVQS